MQEILLLEDFEDTREWLQAMLGKAFPGASIVAVSTVSEAKKAIAEKAALAVPQYFNLALLDLNLPDGNGLEVARLLAQDSAGTYVVISTIYDDDHHVFEALQAGVNGYLLKEQPEAELIRRIQGIARGEPPLTPAIARKILRHFQRQNQSGSGLGFSPSHESSGERSSVKVKKVAPEKNANTLTPREVEVLTLVAKGLSRKEIARLLEITPHTASGYVKSIYQKLNISSRSEAAIEATRMGYVEL